MELCVEALFQIFLQGGALSLHPQELKESMAAFEPEAAEILAFPGEQKAFLEAYRAFLRSRPPQQRALRCFAALSQASWEALLWQHHRRRPFHGSGS